ncbi:putative Ankyrin repeat (many copies)/Ankyrin repeat (3 copies)/Ankyrin repeat [Leishmania naiffi]|uniref:Ankyrin repeat (Many copies)/Ankyrin repeat (3 copies)/Ankyrin repeat n=1 Tax=Leishmania naiffi TaxID=5678 RepID=A0AAW3BMK2_9TRYP
MLLAPSLQVMDLVHMVIQGNLSALIEDVTPSNVNYTDAQYRLSLLMWAVTLNRLPTAQVLLSRGASLALVDRHGFTILHRAVWNADVPIIHMVLFITPMSAVASSSDAGATGTHPFTTSSQSASSSLLTWRPGAQRLVNAVHPATGRTPLMLAALSGRVDVVRFLLVTCAADPYPRDSYGLTAVDLAALCGHLHVVQQLLNLTVAPNGAGGSAADVFPTTQCRAEDYIEVAKTIPQRQRLCAVNKLLNENLTEASRVAAT